MRRGWVNGRAIIEPLEGGGIKGVALAGAAAAAMDRAEISFVAV